MRRGIGGLALALALALAVTTSGGFAPSAARAQAVACRDTVLVPDLPFLHENAMWARTAGMGGAQLAVGADAAALHANPAGLALIRRIEAAGSVRRISVDAATTSFGTVHDENTTATALSAFSVAYPLPVYRGSFVLAASYERPIAFDLRTLRIGTRPDPGGDLTYEDRVTEDGGLAMYRLGAAVDVAREVSVGGSAFLVGGSDDRSHTGSVARAGGGTTTLSETQNLSVRGRGATLGALFRLSRYSRLGAAVELPRHVTYNGTVNDERIPDQPFRLPFVFGLGLAVTPPFAILAADVAYADWREIDYFGRITVCDEFAYRATADVRLGGELLVPGTLLRVRAGFQSTPLPLRYLPDLTVSTSGDTLAWAPVSFESDRRAVSLGAGYLVAGGFTIDVAWTRETYRRRTTQEAAPVAAGPGIDEHRAVSQVVASVAFRL